MVIFSHFSDTPWLIPKQMSTDVWFLLVDENGDPYEACECSSVDMQRNVDKFKDAVKDKYKDSHLRGIAASNLIVYKCKNDVIER